MTCASCRYGSAVQTVRNGVLENYNTTTVGKAFEGTFKNAKWSSFDTPKGATVVQFDGTIKAIKLTERGFVEFDSIYKQPSTKFINGCIDELGFTGVKDEFNMNWLATTPSSVLRSNNPIDVQLYNIQKCVAAQVEIPIEFQFILSADNASFKIGHISEVFYVNGRIVPSKILAMIYQ